MNTTLKAAFGALAIVAAFAAAPAQAATAHRAHDLGDVVVEFSFENFAWGHVLKGCYVSSSGQAGQFAYPHGGAAWKPADESGQTVTGAELNDKFSVGVTPLRPLTRADRARLGGATPLARQAAGGPFDKKMGGADRGETSLIVYTRRAGGVYQATLLDQVGDRMVTNQSPAAARLRRLLNQMRSAAACLRPPNL